MKILAAMVRQIKMEYYGPGRLHDVYKDASKCCDCSVPMSDHYMVHNELWEKYSKGDRYLCQECLGKRMGRSVEIFDYSNAPINLPYFIGAQAGLDLVKRWIDDRCNNVLCEMRPDEDDSITGFNEAWDIVRKALE